MAENKKYNDLSLKEVVKIANREEVRLVTADSKWELGEIMEEAIRTGRDEYVLLHYQMAHTKLSIQGHWVGMIIKPRIREIYYFDSYGYFPDDQLETIPIGYRKETGQAMRDIGIFLYKAIKKYGYKVRYNDKELQSKDKRIATCGRYTGLFLRFGYTPERYVELLSKVRALTGIDSYDDIITSLTGG